MGTPAISINRATFAGSVSGLYERRGIGGFGHDSESAATLRIVAAETVRLDVDGWYPQKMASGSISRLLVLHGGFVEWAASIVSVSPDVWEGNIIGKWGNKEILPHNKVRIAAAPHFFTVLGAELTITFYDGAPEETRTLPYVSPYFRSVQIEFDTVEGATRVTQFDTASHPNKPSNLPSELLTFRKVFSRAGVEVTRSTGDSVVALSMADADGETPEAWSDFELNQAMKPSWSGYKTGPQWAMWMLFAGLHVDSSVRGIMFDYSGIYKRQGAAVFNDWWLSDSETTGFNHSAEHIRRRRFVTACHETGHCFNLIHSWEHAASGWWPLGDERFAASFMNRPEDAPATSEFFADFEYRFSDRELKFIRHAPVDFIQMGGMRYGDEVADALRKHDSGIWFLEASVRRSTKVFDFLEPVILDLALTNRSNRPQVVDEGIFRDGHNLHIAIRHGRDSAVMLRPYVVRCMAPRWRVLEPGESLGSSLFVSAGVEGWHIAEPGPYQIRAVLSAGEIQALSDPLRIRVAHSCDRDQENIAQDFFTNDTGRALALGGAARGSAAYGIMERILERLPERAAARHAMLAMGMPQMRAYKNLVHAQGEAAESKLSNRGRIEVVRGNVDEARRLLEAALKDGDGVDTFGAHYLANVTESVRQWLDSEGDPAAAKKRKARNAARKT